MRIHTKSQPRSPKLNHSGTNEKPGASMKTPQTRIFTTENQNSAEE